MKHLIRVIVSSLLAGAVAACAAGDSPEPEQPPLGAAPEPEQPSLGVAQAALSDEECPPPRPRNRGCSIVCKPCQIATCEGGEWIYESVDWGDECDGAAAAARSVARGTRSDFARRSVTVAREGTAREGGRT